MLKRTIAVLLINLLTISISFASQSPAPHKPMIKSISTKSSTLLDLTALIKDSNLQLAVRNPETGMVSYTRNGKFIKKNGYFYQGANRLQGYAVPAQITNEGCTLIDLQPIDDVPFTPTTYINFQGNLDANSELPNAAFDINNSNSYNYTMRDNNLFDLNGAQHTLTLYFIKSAALSWNVQVAVDNNLIGAGQVDFEVNGAFKQSSGIARLAFMPGQTLTINLSGLTAYAYNYMSIPAQDDGHQSADAIAESVDENGYISEVYSNNESVTFGKIAVFRS